jgi:hypothetical protein
MKQNFRKEQEIFMQGLEQSEKFFLEYGRPLFEQLCPEIFPRLAFDLAGHGSECFGFDDEVSRDHDFTRGFAVWLSAQDEEIYGYQLTRTYLKLMKEHARGSSGESSKLGEMEHGICRIGDFFSRHIGCPGIPGSWQEWMNIPDYALAEALNGKVFLDDHGEFSAIRQGLRTGMPEDVRLKKIAARLALMAQSGQYNYLRCHRHNEPGAAAIALTEFVKECVSLIFLLNRQFCPYYKWMFRAMLELQSLSELAAPLEFLLTDHAPPPEKYALIEDICCQIKVVLKNQELSESSSDYLEAQAFDVMKKIKNPQIRALHVMA